MEKSNFSMTEKRDVIMIRSNTNGKKDIFPTLRALALMKILPQETVLFLENPCNASTETEVQSMLRRGVRLDNPKFYSNAQTL